MEKNTTDVKSKKRRRTKGYRFKKRRGLDSFPAIRAADAAHNAIAQLCQQWKQKPLDVQRANAASSQMRRSLIVGFANPPGSKQRYQEHRVAWRAARTLDRLVASSLNSSSSEKSESTAAKVAQRAVDRVDVLISALPGVDLL
jgi:hypothetical protein